MKKYNYKITVAYDGTRYHGWNIQPNKITIQQIIQDCLHKIFKYKIKIVCAGRTDSGVHALNQIFNFIVKRIDIKPNNLKKALNSNLPEDIIIKSVKIVPLEFSSRYDAKCRIYKYYINNSGTKNIKTNRFELFYPYKLNIDLMNNAAGKLIGKHNFLGFTSTKSCSKTYTREIYNIKLNKTQNNRIIITIKAAGFLHNMVRIIVGTLIEIGRGKFKPSIIDKILKSKNRKLAGPTVKPHGLFLYKIEY